MWKAHLHQKTIGVIFSVTFFGSSVQFSMNKKIQHACDNVKFVSTWQIDEESRPALMWSAVHQRSHQFLLALHRNCSHCQSATKKVPQKRMEPLQDSDRMGFFVWSDQILLRHCFMCKCFVSVLNQLWQDPKIQNFTACCRPGLWKEQECAFSQRVFSLEWTSCKSCAFRSNGHKDVMLIFWIEQGGLTRLHQNIVTQRISWSVQAVNCTLVHDQCVHDFDWHDIWFSWEKRAMSSMFVHWQDKSDTHVVHMGMGRSRSFEIDNTVVWQHVCVDPCMKVACNLLRFVPLQQLEPKRQLKCLKEDSMQNWHELTTNMNTKSSNGKETPFRRQFAT